MSVLKKLFSRKSEIEPKLVQSPASPAQVTSSVKAQEELWFSETVGTPQSVATRPSPGSHGEERASIYSTASSNTDVFRSPSGDVASASVRTIANSGWAQAAGGQGHLDAHLSQYGTHRVDTSNSNQLSVAGIIKEVSSCARNRNFYVVAC